ncbi:uncharacterized protein LOC117170242 [Belonocnema kinseyi]|uniref:uncharacterized protein LOC117170242 n=1 Tax=Belonocnema kinseyi TaxID=2817044 RepID=UPI00143DAD57|nr:uncharacterized protein LOC117170242 [Belonocnema kinseyi]
MFFIIIIIIIIIIATTQAPENKMHCSVLNRWQYYFPKGLRKNERRELKDLYGSLSGITALLINPELVQNVSKEANTRDLCMLNQQQTATAALAAIGQVAELIIQKETKIDRKYVFKLLLDSLLLRRAYYLPILCTSKLSQKEVSSTLPKEIR